MTVVGIGADGWTGLTEASRDLIDGAAVGRSTLKRMKVRDAPKAMAASRTDWGTEAMPSAVRRTTGGMPKMMVAIIPEGLPMPKRAMTGIRYTKAGMVCMKSSSGRTMAATFLL